MNQRPLAPQEPPVAAQRSPAVPNSSESLAPAPRDAVQRSQGSTTIRRNCATNLPPPIERLLTVRQVAAQFGVCTATVYKWAVDGVLPHVRIVNVVRVRPEDLTTFIAERLARAIARRVRAACLMSGVAFAASEGGRRREDRYAQAARSAEDTTVHDTGRGDVGTGLAGREGRCAGDRRQTFAGDLGRYESRRWCSSSARRRMAPS